MSRRIAVLVGRGITDKTVSWVYPWELPILQLVHGGEVEAKTIDELCDMKHPVKVEKVKQKHSDVEPPDLRQQYEIMAYVDPEEDPAANPDGEYERLANKYGMDKELPIACVARVYGEFSSGAFERTLKEHADDRAPKPAYLKAVDEGLGRSPSDMTINELRKALHERGIAWTVKDKKLDLIAKLDEALVD